MPEGFTDLHSAQQSFWDCGLACAEMAIKWQSGRARTVSISRDQYEPLPLWTIDIFKVLRDHELGEYIQMFTLSAGLQPYHYSMTWYEANMDKDFMRITSLFEASRIEDWGVEERARSSEDLVSAIVSEGCICIVLVDVTTLDKAALISSSPAPSSDHYFLESATTKTGSGASKGSGVRPVGDISNPLSLIGIALRHLVDFAVSAASFLVSATATTSGATSSSSSPSSNTYMGHYIVVTGYTPPPPSSFFALCEGQNDGHYQGNGEGIFCYLDPARVTGVGYITTKQLDTARQMQGTDQDIIVISRKKIKK